MKYIAVAIAFAIVILTVWFVLVTPPCDGDHNISLGGEEYFLFSCENINSPQAKIDQENQEPVAIEVAEISTPVLPQSTQETVTHSSEKCTGVIQTVLSNNIAEHNRWISIQSELRLHVLALSSAEADLSVRSNTGYTIKTFTMRAGRTEIFKFNQFEYRLTLNSIENPTYNDLRVNVTMHKIACT
jgi:hypothetical protein